MPIAFTCPSCGRIGRLPDDFKADKVKCPGCQTVSPAPYRLADSPPPAPTPSGENRVLRQGPSAATPSPSGENRALRQGSPAGSPGPKPTPRPMAKAEEIIDLGAGGEKKGPTPMMLGLIAGGIAALVVMVGLGVLAVVLLTRTNTAEPAGVHSVALAPGHLPVPAPRVVAKPRVALPATPPPTPAAATATTAPAVLDPALAGLPGAPATPPTAAAAATNPADLAVQQIKDATVYVKVRAGAAGGSGSGFVMRVEGQTVYIATNHHVVNPHLEGSEEEAGPQAKNVRPRVTVVFRSGQGRQQEQICSAEVVASQREANCDLAILKVNQVKNPPKPIVLDAKTEPTETMPVLIYGFPFGDIGKMLDANAHGNPAMTINRGSVSSLRKDDAGQVAYIQIDGSINPGNSGGPVVDEKGKLVGIAVAAISNTTIGFAIPPAELTEMLDGTVGQLMIALTGLQQGTANLQVQTRVIDPLGRIKAVEFLYLRDAPDKAMPKPNPDGTWPPLANANRVGLAMNGLFASAPLQTTVNGPSGRKMLVQASYQDKDGKTVYMNPTPYEIPARPTTFASIGAPPPGTAGKKAQSFAVLGELVDPSKNCKLTRTDSSLAIDVPGGVHLLSADLESRNSPMLTTTVEGDFAAIVRVAGAMVPGSEPAKYKGKVLPFTFQGAGLVLWQDKNNYVRLEKAVQTTKKTKIVLTSEVLLEICKNGKLAGRVQMNLPEGPIFLLLGRESGGIKCLFGMDGRRWIALKTLAVAFPDKVDIGLSASNASKEALSARFENFALVGGGDKPKAEEP